MGILQRLFGREQRAYIDIESGEGSREADSENGSAAAALLSVIVGTADITPDTAMEIPAFSQSVEFIAKTISMLPVKLYREQPGEEKTKEVTDDPRLRLLNDETGGLMSSMEAKQAQIRDMLTRGAGYMYIKRERSRPVSLHYVRKQDVSVIKNSDPIFRDADILVGAHRYNPWDFIILTRNSVDGVEGKSIAEEHRTLLSAMYSALKYEKIISGTGGNKKGFLQSEKKLTDEAMEKLRRTWEELYSNNSNNMMVLNAGLKYSPSASTSVEMQMNQNKQTNTALITQMFGLSPKVISGECTTEEYMSAIRTGVLPIVEQYQAALNRSMLLESEKSDMYFMLDTTELLKGDTLSRYQAYAIGLQNNFLQIDEVRYAEDKPPLGFNYIKLGLQDVLLNPENGEIYTPNTGQAVNMGRQGLTGGADSGIIEENRATMWIKGEKGLFAGSVSLGPDRGGGIGGGAYISDGGTGTGGSAGGGTLTNSTGSGIIFTDKQKGKKFGKHCSDWGLDPSSDKDRGKMEEIIRSICFGHNEVREGKFGGQKENVLFYIKGSDVVVTKPNGEFITIMKEGVNNGWVKNAGRR